MEFHGLLESVGEWHASCVMCVMCQHSPFAIHVATLIQKNLVDWNGECKCKLQGTDLQFAEFATSLEFDASSIKDQKLANHHQGVIVIEL